DDCHSCHCSTESASWNVYPRVSRRGDPAGRHARVHQRLGSAGSGRSRYTAHGTIRCAGRRRALMTSRPLFTPVILGTPRQGRMSEHVAHFVLGELTKRDGIETTLIDIRTLPFPITDAGEALKDAQFSATIMRAHALVLVVPEYNHGYPGLLKHVLD